MSTQATLRKFATPLTIGASLLLGVTGILMFFHANSGLNKLAHEWVGLAFVAIVGLHVAVNWRPFTAHLKRPVGQAAALAFAALLALSFLPLGGAKGGGRPDFALLQEIQAAPLDALAVVLNESPEGLAERLRGAGFSAADLDSSIVSLTGGDRQAEMELIKVIVAAPQG
ncbi:DUF4405 domain-containing protein [Rhodovulum euryhalinum]|uniref:Uncharacterized protein DUF4405 n=1 Tax=Rhodovulum euryhalinum TaxID=35805 RepID=A0A4R2KN07_9RHOB|nr:DUF4405 domain-containing protein [Rhodovulum euryhalinum]TCO73927.1 uncharacterized protein DUF4405 [Rhodovulum euryhalinum]